MPLGFSTEALAEASARRPWRVIGFWIALLVGSFIVIGTLLSGALTTQAHLTNNPESERADKLLEQRRGKDHDHEIVIVTSATKTVDDPAFKAKVEDVYSRITALGTSLVQDGRTYYWGQQSVTGLR